jgi:hypothetical protein
MHSTKLKMATIGAILAMPLALATSCAGMKNRVMGNSGPKQTYALMPADRAPAATGIVEVGSTDDGNRELAISVEHLPRPSELDPKLTTYVVWIDPGEGEPMAVGQLKVNADREAEADFATPPFQAFDLMVTAEPSATPTKPSGMVVLQGHIYSGATGG